MIALFLLGALRLFGTEEYGPVKLHQILVRAEFRFRFYRKQVKPDFTNYQPHLKYFSIFLKVMKISNKSNS